MSEFGYIICLKNPFEEAPLLLIKHGDKVYNTDTVEFLDKFEIVVSYDFRWLIDRLRKKNIVNFPLIYDVTTAKKIITGKPKSNYKSASRPWLLKNILGDAVSKDSLQWIEEYLQLRTVTPPSKNILVDILNGFEKVWLQLRKELIDNKEDNRFYEIEVPIYNIFLRTQLKGIQISHKKLNDKLDELKSIQYSNYKKLELEFGFVSQKIKMQMKWADVQNYCFHDSIKEDLDYDFWKYAEIFTEYDPFLSALVSAHKASIDYNALIKYSVDEYSKIYPRFDVMGTVTGRILVSSPGVQYLKKTSRSIFEPRDGFVFIYADFDQFEPGIIASFSKDPKLLELYNNGDIYCELSKLLFGDKDHRKIAKIIFLAFIYGMSKLRLEKFIGSIAGEDSKNKGMAFFEEFKTLYRWKESLCNSALTNGYSESVCGNKRYLESKGKISNQEKRWIPNQFIQGTASYIYKKSLIELDKLVKGVNFSIPMHDAILLEVSEKEEIDVKSLVDRIFCYEFNSVCPEIKASISFEKFSSEF